MVHRSSVDIYVSVRGVLQQLIEILGCRENTPIMENLWEERLHNEIGIGTMEAFRFSG